MADAMLGSALHVPKAGEILSLPFASKPLLHSPRFRKKLRCGIRTSCFTSANETDLIAVSCHRSCRSMTTEFAHLAKARRFLRRVSRSEVCQMDQSKEFLRIQVCASEAEGYAKLATANDSAVLSLSQNEERKALGCARDIQMALFLGISNAVSFASAAYAASNGTPAVVYDALSSGLDFGVQFLYLGSLLALLGIGSFLVVRQILVRRELETAAKDLQVRVRTGEASPLEYFELGAVMLRKKFFPLATRYLEQAIQKWDGDAQDLAQVYNALGFTYANAGKFDKAIAQYEKAVKLQPGYVVAWNNLGDAYEKKKDLPAALKAYEQALLFDPNNRVARTCRNVIKERVERLKGVPVSYD